MIFINAMVSVAMERDTTQRRAIRRVFTETDRPLSPVEVLNEAKHIVAGLGIATVYRNLKAMVDAGWLVPVGLPGEPDRYEQAGKGHHHHFRCRTCEKVFDLHGCPGDMSPMLPSGFRLEAHEVTLFGLCVACVSVPAHIAGVRARP